MNTETLMEMLKALPLEDPYKSFIQGYILGGAVKNTEHLTEEAQTMATYWFVKGAMFALTEVQEYVKKSKSQ